MNNSAKILLVEDEKNLNEVIKLNLELEDYQVDAVFDGNEAISAIKNKTYHLIVLDVMLPFKDGFDVCKEVRQINSDTQIIIISAKDSSTDKIKGLKLGADDYLPKPFDLEELLLRVKSLLRRNKNLHQEVTEYQFGNNVINFTNFEANNGDEKIILTNREIKLLELLINKDGEVVSREEILKQVWGYGDTTPNTRTIDNFILNFRKYFEQNPKKPKYFHSVWGVGYRFTSTK